MTSNRLRQYRESLPIWGITGLAAFLFLWQLGSSSFFIDEVSSMILASEPFGRLLPRLRMAENSPAGYFVLLHLWKGLLGSDAEWVARLPSALAGIALIPGVWRLGTLVDGKRVGYIAALLTAVSPLVLQYAQQARPYMPAMLALTFAAIAALEAERLQSWTWSIAGAGACVVALSLHYAALAVVAPLCAWVLLRRAMDLPMRLVYCVVPATAWLAWLPLALMQRSDHPGSQLGENGTFTRGHAVRVLGAPFDDRYTIEVGLLKIVAAAAILGAIAWAALRSRRSDHSALRLMLAMVLVPLAAVSVASALLGIEIMNSRYITFATPFLLVILGSAVMRLPSPAALASLGALLAIGIVGVAGSHSREGFYPDTRGAINEISAQWRPGDVVLTDSTLGVRFPLDYYARQNLPARAPVLSSAEPAAQQALLTGPRVWIVREEQPSAPSSAALPLGYRTGWVRRFPASPDLTLTLALPRP